MKKMLKKFLDFVTVDDAKDYVITNYDLNPNRPY
jgi:hypothetical protein